MNISFNPQVVKVTAQPPGLKAQAAAAGEDVIITPQTLAVSALSSALGVDIQNPIGRDIIQGMDYETGEWTQSTSVLSRDVSFSKQHSKPPFMFLVYAAPGALNTYTAYGEMFINYLALHGTALQTTLSQAKWGVRVLWTTGSSSSSIGQSVTNITSNSGLTEYATNEHFTFSSYATNIYLRSGKKYSWTAVFMPE